MPCGEYSTGKLFIRSLSQSEVGRYAKWRGDFWVLFDLGTGLGAVIDVEKEQICVA